MTAFKSGDPLTLNRLYGRSSGHKLRKRQQELVDELLPQIEVPAEGEISARALFADDRHRFTALIASWPPDIRDHVVKLACGDHSKLSA